MQLIRELEKPRGIYTGAIGVIQPNQNAVFSIGIRTLELKKEREILESVLELLGTPILKKNGLKF